MKNVYHQHLVLGTVVIGTDTSQLKHIKIASLIEHQPRTHQRPQVSRSWSSKTQLVIQANKSTVPCSAHPHHACACYQARSIRKKTKSFFRPSFLRQAWLCLRLRFVFVLPPAPPYLKVLRGWCAWKSKGLIELMACCYAVSLTDTHINSCVRTAG